MTETVGLEPTDTVTESVAVPPGPEQDILYVFDEVRLPVPSELPEALLEPLQAPEAVQEVAFVTVQRKVVDSLYPIEVLSALRSTVGAIALNVAVTLLFAVIETGQEPVPEQAPDQPANIEPETGLAVRVTEVPWANEAEQVPPQLIPEGLEVTVPEPVPDLETERVLGDCPTDTLTESEALSPATPVQVKV